jgi:hypothetical protein
VAPPYRQERLAAPERDLGTDELVLERTRLAVVGQVGHGGSILKDQEGGQSAGREREHKRGRAGRDVRPVASGEEQSAQHEYRPDKRQQQSGMEQNCKGEEAWSHLHLLAGPWPVDVLLLGSFLRPEVSNPDHDYYQ